MDRITGGSLKTVLFTMAAAFIVTVTLLSISSNSPVQSIIYFFTGPFQNRYNLGNMLDNSALLIITGLGMIIAFRAGTFNLGGEGQVYAGAITAVLITLHLGSATGTVGITAAVGGAITAGALIAGISGYLKEYWNTDELISSFLLSGAIIHLIDYLITGPFRDKSSYLVSTQKIPEKFYLTKIMGSSHLNISIFIALILVLLVYFFLFKSTAGYELRLSGLNKNFLKYGGIPHKRHTIIPMLISGGLYGLAGSFTVLGNIHMGVKGLTYGLGWNGIAVALIAGNNPMFVIPAGIIFAFLESGTQTAMIHSDLSFEFSNLIKAVIFFLITVKSFNFKKGRSID